MTTTAVTLAEFEQMPKTAGKQELIDGEVICLPPPKLKHSTIAKRVYL